MRNPYSQAVQRKTKPGQGKPIRATKKGSGRNNSLFTKVFFGVQNFLFCDVVHLFDRPPPFVRIYPAKDKAIYVSMPLNMCRPMEVNILLIATTILRKI